MVTSESSDEVGKVVVVALLNLSNKWPPGCEFNSDDQ